jgi:hypothetical protein
MREFLKAINDYSETSFLLFLALIAIIGVLKKK